MNKSDKSTNCKIYENLEPSVTLLIKKWQNETLNELNTKYKSKYPNIKPNVIIGGDSSNSGLPFGGRGMFVYLTYTHKKSIFKKADDSKIKEELISDGFDYSNILECWHKEYYMSQYNTETTKKCNELMDIWYNNTL